MQPGLCRKIKAKDDGKEKTTWQKGDVITAEKLNKLENAIELINSGLD